MDLFTLKATLGLDTSDYATKIAQTIQDAQTDAKKLDEALNGKGTPTTGVGLAEKVDGATSSVSGFGTTVASILTSRVVEQGISTIVRAGDKAISAASDLVEVQNVIDNTFGSSAEQINRWAEVQAGAYGLSELQAKQFAGYYGSMLQTAGIGNAESAEMAMNLAELAGDIASFYNIEIEEAYRKIQSGLVGEREPLLGYGLDLGAEAVGEHAGMKLKDMTNEERFQARYNYLMDKTSPIQGDYMRTSDELANGQRTLENNLARLSADFGEKLLPIMKAGTNVANDFFAALYAESTEETLENIDATARNTSESIKATATNARAMVGVLEDYGDKSALTAEEQAQWSAVAGELIRAIPELSGMIDMQTGKIEGGTSALAENIDAWEAAGKMAADTAALEEKRGMLSDISAEIAKEQGLLAVAEKQLEQNQGEVIELGAKVAESLGREFDGTVESTRKLLDSNAGWYAALKTGMSEADILALFAPLNEAETAIEGHKENIKALQEEYGTVEQSIAQDSAALSDAVEIMERDVTDSFDGVERATDSLVSNFDQSSAAYDNSYSTGISAANGLNDAYPAYGEAASQYTFNPSSPGGGGESETQGFATGLDYVPYNDFPAYLHEGEAVLTKAEASAWRQGGNTQYIDYATLGSVVGEAVREALDGVGVYMGAERVGDLVTERVSYNIANRAQSRRFAV